MSASRLAACSSEKRPRLTELAEGVTPEPELGQGADEVGDALAGRIARIVERTLGRAQLVALRIRGVELREVLQRDVQVGQSKLQRSAALFVQRRAGAALDGARHVQQRLSIARGERDVMAAFEAFAAAVSAARPML